MCTQVKKTPTEVKGRRGCFLLIIWKFGEMSWEVCSGLWFIRNCFYGWNDWTFELSLKLFGNFQSYTRPEAKLETPHNFPSETTHFLNDCIEGKAPQRMRAWSSYQDLPTRSRCLETYNGCICFSVSTAYSLPSIFYPICAVRSLTPIFSFCSMIA